MTTLRFTWPIAVTSTGCHEWRAAISSEGYGRVGQEYAHRIAYERAKGPIPDGLELDHLCRNRRCVNPDHLEAVTHAENIRRAYPTCPRGHEWTPGNIYRSPGRPHQRQCRACIRMRSSRAWQAA